MRYNFNGKTLNIPDAEIERSMKILKLTKEEAIEMWLDDEGYTEDAEQVALTQKAKENRITATIHSAKEEKEKKAVKRERKEDPEKEMIIQKIAEILPEFAENVTITNVGKLISFKIGENDYEIDLKRKRKPKKQAKIPKTEQKCSVFLFILPDLVIFYKKLLYNSFILYIDFMAAPWYNERAADARCGPVPGSRAYMAIFPSCLDLGPATWVFPEYRDPCHMDPLIVV